MSLDAYSQLKAAWHLADIAKLRVGQKIAPRHLYLVISDLCNQDCHFCTYRAPTGWGSENFGADTGKGFTMNPNRMLPTGKALEILADFAAMGGKAVQFTGGGEPTVHPEADTIMACALNLGLQVGLVTNGTRIPKGIASRLAWIRVSIDAGREATYERTRASKLWQRVLLNLKELCALEGPAVGANFVTTRENYRELVLFCTLMKGLGVPYVKISANLTTEGLAYYDGLLPEIEALMADARALEGPRFRIVNVFERRLLDLKIGAPEHPFCGQQQFTAYVGADQKVYRCCNTAYTTPGLIGDLSKATFREWWRGYSFEGFDARRCPHCQFQEKNQAIAYLIQERPQHVEFV